MPENPLDALRDIHLPDAASWWPLAWGYWLVLALCIVAALLWFRRYRALRVRRSSQREFNKVVADFHQHEDGLRLARDLSVLMRRVMLSLQPRESVAGLTGDQWVEAVQQLVSKHSLKEVTLETLSSGIYQSAAHIDTSSLITDCASWFAQLPAQPSVTGAVK